MKCFSMLCGFVFSTVLAGCAPEQGGAPSPAQEKMPVLTEAAADKKPQLIQFVRVLMSTFEVPLGAASESEEIWSYLDEEPVGAVRGLSLARNGIRVGMGRHDDWPDLARILKRMKGRTTKRTSVTAFPGIAMPITLKAKQPAQTVFTLHEDHTFTGAEYPEGDNLLTVVFALNEDDRSVVQITALPQIRSSARKPRVVRRGGDMMIAEKPKIYSFHPLIFQVSVPSRDFIVVGPSAESRRPHSAGKSFLISERDGMPFETVQLLMPEVYAAPARVTRLP